MEQAWCLEWCTCSTSFILLLFVVIFKNTVLTFSGPTCAKTCKKEQKWEGSCRFARGKSRGSREILRDFPRPWVLHPETRGISRGRSPREIPRVEGCKTHGQGKSRGRRGWIFQSLPNLGGARTFSHHYQGRPSLVFIVI